MFVTSTKPLDVLGKVIVSFLLVSAVFYGFFLLDIVGLKNKRLRASWALKALSVVHATVVATMSIWALFYEKNMHEITTGILQRDAASVRWPLVHARSDVVAVAAPLTLAYFLFDLALIPVWEGRFAVSEGAKVMAWSDIQNLGPMPMNVLQNVRISKKKIMSCSSKHYSSSFCFVSIIYCLKQQQVLIFLHHGISIVTWPFGICHPACHYFLLCCLSMEFSTPFVQYRWFILQSEDLGKNHPLYIFNGIIMTIAFALCRLCPMLPLNIWAILVSAPHSAESGLPWTVRAASSVLVLPNLLNAYWGYIMIKGLTKVLFSLGKPCKEASKAGRPDNVLKMEKSTEASSPWLPSPAAKRPSQARATALATPSTQGCEQGLKAA